MAHLIACIGTDKVNHDSVAKVLSSGFFDVVYLVMDNAVHYAKSEKQGVRMIDIRIDFSKASEDIVPELYVVLKRAFMQDKLQEIDIAVNISSGSGKEHAVLISTLMKLGYGIRLVDIDKNGNLLEM